MLVSSRRVLLGAAATTALSVAAWSQTAQTQPAQTSPPAAQSGQAAAGQAGQAGAAQGQAAQGQAAQGDAAQGQAAATGEKQKAPKNQEEYDIFTAVTKETDHAKRIGLLDTWKQKFPDSDYKKDRLLYYLDSYRNLNQLDKLVATAKEILAQDPNDVNAMFWIATIVPNLPNAATSPEYISLAEKAGQGIVANLDATFAPAKKQANVTDEQWKKARTDMEATGYKASGWSAMVNKNPAGARDMFTKSLQANPAAAEVSYWLGNMIVADKDPKTIPEGLYHLARAASYDGPGSLTPQGRASVNDFVTKYYNAFHGPAPAELEQIKAQAKANPFPPAGFTIKSKAQIQQEQLQAEAEKEKADPIGANWKRLKEGLTGPQGAEYATSMKDAEIPFTFRGTVVESSPKTIVLAMSDKTTGELTLTPAEGVFPRVEAGTELTFEKAVGKTFTAQPFMLSLEIDRANIKGLPASAKKPAAAPKRGGRRR